jgi:hypothetical protein
VTKSAIDAVERFQGGERSVILVSATGSDRGYLLTSSDFLLDPRRLTVSLSRAKRKMILVASRSVFTVFRPGGVPERVALEESVAANLHDAALGGGAPREAGGGLGMPCRPVSSAERP